MRDGCVTERGEMENGHTFRHRNDHKRDRDDENLNEGNALLVRRPIVALSELDEEPDHERGKEDEASGAAQLGNELCEIVKLRLEGCVLRVAT